MMKLYTFYGLKFLCYPEKRVVFRRHNRVRKKDEAADRFKRIYPEASQEKKTISPFFSPLFLLKD